MSPDPDKGLCVISFCSNKAVYGLWFCEDCEKNQERSVKETAFHTYRQELEAEAEESTGPNKWDELLKLLEAGTSVLMSKDRDRYIVTAGLVSRTRETLGEAVEAVSK